MAGILEKGPGAADEVRALFDRLQPTLPIVLANLVEHRGSRRHLSAEPRTAAGAVAAGHRASRRRSVCTSEHQAGLHGRCPDLQPEPDDPRVPRRSCCRRSSCRRRAPPGSCPPSSSGCPTFEDYPDRAPGDVYCRVPQDSPFNVRGARNLPCVTVPGKRAPTVARCARAMRTTCRSTTATTGRATPTPRCPDRPFLSCHRGRHLRKPLRRRVAAPPPIAAAEYDPANGTYVGPDGRVSTQSNLARRCHNEEQTWQTMLLPPTGN